MSAEQDTASWLLDAQERCPACGEPLAPGAAACPACRRDLLVTVRPAQRSVTSSALAGAWGVIALYAALTVTGSALQLAGLMQPTNSPQATLALALGGAAAGLLAALMCWGCRARRPFALYGGIALALAVGLGGIGAGLALGGELALYATITSVLVTSGLLFMHLSVAREFLGERRRLDLRGSATSAIGLYQEGRALYEAGLPFAAAQRWARALGKDTSNAAYMHALGIALARLGHHDRAADLLDQALRVTPGNRAIQESIDLVRQQAATRPGGRR